MCGSWDPQLPPLLPPLFKFNKFVKYDTLGSFCTKNQVCIIRRSWDQVISILFRSWKNQRFFPTSRLRFCPPLLSISAKIWNFLLWNIVSLQPRVVRRWFFILVNSDVPFFWKIKILKKGGQRGGRYLNMKFNDNYDKKYKYDAQNRSQSLVLCYIWSESMFRNNAPPFAPPKNAPPFAPPPLIFIPLG